MNLENIQEIVFVNQMSHCVWQNFVVSAEHNIFSSDSVWVDFFHFIFRADLLWNMSAVFDMHFLFLLMKQSECLDEYVSED